MTDSRLPNWAFGNTRKYTHFSKLTGEAQATAASIGAFSEVVVYEGGLVIGKKPGKELYFIRVDGVQRVSDLLTCETELFGRAESLGTLPESSGRHGSQRARVLIISGNAPQPTSMGHGSAMER